VTPTASRRRLLIAGRVQGVFFRASCADEARRLGVLGFARNLRDGRVEVVVEGDADAVDALVEWCRHGPPNARVDAVEIVDEAPEGLVRFAVR
jgi:acylphosphatase